MALTPLETALISIATAGCAFYAYRGVCSIIADLKASATSILAMSGRVVELRASVDENNTIQRQNAESYTCIPKLLNGMTEVAKAQVDEYVRMRLAIDRFSQLVIRPTEEKDALTEYDEFEADKSYKKQIFMAGGMTESDAAAKVEAEQQGALVYMPSNGE